MAVLGGGRNKAGGDEGNDGDGQFAWPSGHCETLVTLPLLVGLCSYSFLQSLGLTMTNRRCFENVVRLYGAFCSFRYFVTIREDGLKWPAILNR